MITARPFNDTLSQARLSLTSTEEQLASRFRALREARNGQTVYLIEHGLGPDQSLELRTLLGSQLRRHGLAPGEWIDLAHCIGVAVTEIAYSYRGTGTDFWPRVESQLGVELMQRERHEITALFEHLHRKSGFAAPFPTDWTRAYGHIAWPIRNAVAPLELHRPLTELLSRVLDEGVRAGTEEFANRMKATADGMWSRRLGDWLLDGALAHELIRRLLFGTDQESWLDETLVNRLIIDLGSDPVTRRNMKRVRRAAARPERRPQGRIGDCRWRLSVVNGQPAHLLLASPVVTEQEVRRLLDSAGGDRPIGITGAASRMLPLSDFLSGELIAVDPPSAAAEGVTLGADRDGQVQAPLEDLIAGTPRIFIAAAEGGLFNGLPRGSRIEGNTRLIALTWSAPETETSLWRGPAWIVGTAKDPEIAKALQQAGVTVQDERLLDFAGAIALFEEGDELNLASGLPLLCRIRRPGVSIQLDDRVIVEEAAEGQLIEIPLEEGLYRLQAGVGSPAVQWTLKVAAPDDQGAFFVETSPAQPAIDDLLGDQLELIVHSPLFIGPIPARLELHGDGRLLDAVEWRLEAAPCRLGPASSALRQLRAKAAAALGAGSAHRFGLTVRFNGLGQFAVALPPRPAIYRRAPGTGTFLREDGRAVRTLCATASAPLPSEDMVSAGTDVVLHLPDGGEPEDLRSGAVTAFSPAVLMAAAPPAEIRSHRATCSLGDRIGFDQAVDAFLSWRCASSDSLIADRRRHSVAEHLEFALVEALCGEEWARLERSRRAFHGDDLEALVEVALASYMATGREFPALDRAERPELKTRLRARFAAVLPAIRMVFVDDDLAASLDAAICGAYEDLNRVREEIGVAPFEEPDPGHSPDQWMKALLEAVEMADRPMLRRLVLPAARWDRLSRLDYALASGDHLVDVLDQAHLDVGRQGRGRWITRQTLRVGLQFWLCPREIFDTAEWRTHLHRLLSDRHTSRAIRYAAIRSRMAAQHGESSDVG